MGKKVITVTLSTKSINEAIRELEEYRKDFLKKVDLLRSRLGEEIRTLAQAGFDTSGVDDTLRGGTRPAEVTVTASDNGKITIVLASGKDAVWCEFGAGVYHNGAVGSSPNPYGSDLGLTIGSFGDGHGSQNVWGYLETPGDPNTLVLTHGTEATMPMYNAVQTIVPMVVNIAREVFS